MHTLSPSHHPLLQLSFKNSSCEVREEENPCSIKDGDSSSSLVWRPYTQLQVAPAVPQFLSWLRELSSVHDAICAAFFFLCLPLAKLFWPKSEF